MALCRGTAAPPTVTTTTNPEYHRGGVLPHGTNTARPQTSIGTPVEARGVTILRRQIKFVEKNSKIGFVIFWGAQRNKPFPLFGCK